MQGAVFPQRPRNRTSLEYLTIDIGRNEWSRRANRTSRHVYGRVEFELNGLPRRGPLYPFRAEWKHRTYNDVLRMALVSTGTRQTKRFNFGT